MTPYNYQQINLYNSQVSPSTVHCRNTGLVRYYEKYLFQKILSLYKFENIPANWNKNYFIQCLLGIGYVAVFNSGKFGVIPQHCTLSGMNIFYEPKKALISNPLLTDFKELEIDKECTLIQCMPDFTSPMDIVSFYADMLALSAETASTNLINSKLAYLFTAQNKALANTFKKIYDDVASGEPAVVIDKELLNDDGTLSINYFAQNLAQNYIAGDILDDMKKWEDRFNTDIGIPNANTEKKERLITDEVNANNVDTRTKSDLWLECINEGINKTNEMFGLNIRCDYRNKAVEVTEEETVDE